MLELTNVDQLMPEDDSDCHRALYKPWQWQLWTARKGLLSFSGSQAIETESGIRISDGERAQTHNAATWTAWAGIIH